MKTNSSQNQRCPLPQRHVIVFSEAINSTFRHHTFETETELQGLFLTKKKYLTKDKHGNIKIKALKSYRPFLPAHTYVILLSYNPNPMKKHEIKLGLKVRDSLYPEYGIGEVISTTNSSFSISFPGRIEIYSSVSNTIELHKPLITVGERDERGFAMVFEDGVPTGKKMLIFTEEQAAKLLDLMDRVERNRNSQETDEDDISQIVSDLDNDIEDMCNLQERMRSDSINITDLSGYIEKETPRNDENKELQ